MARRISEHDATHEGDRSMRAPSSPQRRPPFEAIAETLRAMYPKTKEWPHPDEAARAAKAAAKSDADREEREGCRKGGVDPALDAARQAEAGIQTLLETLSIASATELQKMNRKLDKISRRLKKLEDQAKTTTDA